MKFLRLHLFEFEDLPWYPDLVRKPQTDYLRFMMNVFDVFKAIVPLLASALEKSGNPPLLDLCSGGGGSMLKMQQHLHKRGIRLRATLSDLYPNTEAFSYVKQASNGDIDFIAEPVNALNVPAGPKVFRTIFNGFHHFTPAQAQQILQDAVKNRAPIGIFEPIDKSPMQLLVNAVALTVLMLLVMPFVRPFRWEKIVFTYLLPLIPLCTLWDGIVSVIRLYRPNELLYMARQADAKGYHWQAGKASHTFGKVIYLIGLPVTRAEQTTERQSRKSLPL